MFGLKTHGERQWEARQKLAEAKGEALAADVPEDELYAFIMRTQGELEAMHYAPDGSLADLTDADAFVFDVKVRAREAALRRLEASRGATGERFG